MTELAKQNCVPCRGGIPPASGDQVTELLGQLDGWAVEPGHKLARTYGFPDFAGGLGFVNRVGAIAEQQGHHPDFHLTWGKVRVDVWTHDIWID